MPDINYGQILEALNGKVDLDGSWSFPSTNYEDLTLGSSGTTYEMPADGYLFLRMTMTGSYSNMIFQNDTTGRAEVRFSSGTLDIAITMPVCKSEVIKVYYGAAGSATKVYFRFIYAKKTN